MNLPGTPKCLLMASLLAGFSIPASAQSLQLVSVPDPSEPSPAGGGGDSWGPTLSRNGRYVLFSSTANNLLLATNNDPIPPGVPAVLNVFLRDRTNATTTLVSVNLSGVAGGNDDSVPIDISTNGRYALFESSASDLVPGDTNNATDVFVRDLVTGTTMLVSVNTNGVAGNGASGSSTMSPDGRYVAFVSDASDLVPGDTNGISDIFVRDLQADTTILVSVGAVSSSTNVPTGSSEAPSITPDGRYVAFYSTATNLVAGAPTTGDVYVRDLMAGTTIWASTGARAAIMAALGQTNTVCFNHALSDDGQVVAYEASAAFSTLGLILRYNLGTGLTELIHTNAAVDRSSYPDISSLQMTPDGRYIAFLANTNDTSGETTCVLVWDAQSGTISLASGDLTGSVPPFSVCEWPAISSDGRFAMFLSSAVGLVTNDTPGDFAVYLRDLQTGTTTLIDIDTNGVGSVPIPNSMPSMSADGHFVAYDCNDGSLVANDRNRFSDAFVRNVMGGTTELVSVHDPALPCVTPNGGSSIAATSISADGRFVAFASDADNLVSNDTNEFGDIFVRDMLGGTNLLVSINTNGLSGNGESYEPAISPDGRYVAFTSNASDLVPGDTNLTQDLFVRDLKTGTTTLTSINSSGTGPGNSGSYSPVISTDGRFVLFRSGANNLASGTFRGQNLYLRDRQAGLTYALTHNGVAQAAMTPDGRFVFFGADGTPGITLYVWDSENAGTIYTNIILAAIGAGNLAISGDGKTLVYAISSDLYSVDLITQTNRLLDSGAFSYNAARLSGNGALLTCIRLSSRGGTNQIYLYDTRTGNATPVSRNPLSGDLGNGPSDSPDISVDGRFVGYRSAASNIVTNANNDFPNILLYDVQNGTNSLLSTRRFTGAAPNNRSLRPVFSGDGRTLCYVSWASDLVPLDFNQNSDIFAFSFLYVNILPSPSGQGMLLSWPHSPAKNYRVEFKDKVNGAEWQELAGTVTNTANKAWLVDPTTADEKFYRVIAY